MAQKKIITVFGATGAQGGGLARAILNDPDSEFSVRAVTRDPSSEKAKELADTGAEVIQADIDKPDTMEKALQGAYGAYFVTFIWDHFSPEKEIEEVKQFTEVAKKAGLKHIIWSTLEDTRKLVPLEDDRMPTLQGKYKVPHFDAKGEADHFFKEANLPTTFMIASFYWDNFIHFGAGPKKAEDGNYYLTFPLDDKRMSGIASEDIGKCAYGIFKKGEELIGQTIGIAGEHLTGQDIADGLSDALQLKIIYNNVSPDTYRSFDFPGADDLGNMFQYYRDFEKECMAVRDVDFSRQLNPELKSYKKWLAENATKIPLE
ncbi:NmrA/HSCARG family protein [Litoribacter populi]|uniref:NmrA/HSCARG family protein n=1 Tax=Litoribacter populi TaxID=2598460 RepID=UPI001180EB25|nr:NmrA/HSCARG family protein [Litoribacter populi]